MPGMRRSYGHKSALRYDLCAGRWLVCGFQSLWWFQPAASKSSYFIFGAGRRYQHPGYHQKSFLEDDFPESESGETSKNAFKIILPNINAKYKKGSNSVLPSEPLVNNSDGVQTSARGEKVLEYARLHGAVTRNDIIGLLGVSSSTAVRILKKLVKSNLLKQNGRARSTRYTIVK